MAFTITPTTALPTTDTQVQIGATVYELNHLSAADGAALYTALGTTGTKTNYQQLADQISAIVQNYQSVVALDVPAGQDPQKYILDLLQKVKDSAGKLPDNATEEMKKVYAQLKAIPGFSNILDTTEGVTTFMGVIGDLFSGAGKGLALPFRLKDAAKDAKDGAANWLDGNLNPISKAQADTFGAVYAAAVYKSVDGPTAQAQAKPADWLDKTLAGIGFGWDWLTQKFPSLNAIPYAIEQWLGEDKTWAHAWESAKQEADARSANPAAITYQNTLDARMLGKVQPAARASAAQTLGKVQDVAGLSTKNLSGIVQQGGVYRANDGTYNVLTFDKNGTVPQTQALVDPKGAPITSGTKGKEVAAGILPTSKSEAVGETAAVVGATYATVKVGKGVGQGIAGELVGKDSRPMQKSTATSERATKILEESKKIRAESEATRLDQPAGKHWWEPAKKADPVKADKLLKKADDLLAESQKIDLEKIEHIAKATARKDAISGTKLGDKILKKAEAKPEGWLEKTGDFLGKGIGRVSNGILNLGERYLPKITAPLVKIGESAFAKFGAKTISKTIPLVGEAYMAKDDLINGYQGIEEGNGKKVAHASSSIAGGLACAEVGAQGGAAAGAAVGAFFFGAGAAPGAVIGGIIGSVGGFISGQWLGGKTCDAIAGGDNKAVTQSTAQPDPGLQAEGVKATVKAQNQEKAQTAAKATMATVNKTQIGAIGNAGTPTAPITYTNATTHNLAIS